MQVCKEVWFGFFIVFCIVLLSYCLEQGVVFFLLSLGSILAFTGIAILFIDGEDDYDD